MISKAQILKQLEPFKAAVGKPVIVHTSLRAIGEIEGGGDTLLSCLIEFFTQNGGLLCIPTHTWDKEMLDLREKHTCLGTLPSLALKRADAVRTMHPTHSMVVFGEKEKVSAFIQGEEHVDTPTSPNGCYGKIYNEGGFALLIGIGQEKNTFLHCVEEMLSVPKRLTKEKRDFPIIYENGECKAKKLYWFYTDEIEDVSENFGKFEAAFNFHSAITYGKIGNAKTQLCSASKMKETIELIYNRNSFKELLDNNSALDEKLYK